MIPNHMELPLTRYDRAAEQYDNRATECECGGLIPDDADKCPRCIAVEIADGSRCPECLGLIDEVDGSCGCSVATFLEFLEKESA